MRCVAWPFEGLMKSTLACRLRSTSMSSFALAYSLSCAKRPNRVALRSSTQPISCVALGFEEFPLIYMQFDGLDTFPTHICHLQLGRTTTPSPLGWPLPADTDVTDVAAETRSKMDDPNRAGSRLLELALAWLANDRKMRETAPEGTYKPRGAHKSDDPTDSEKFYRAYDYGSREVR